MRTQTVVTVMSHVYDDVPHVATVNPMYMTTSHVATVKGGTILRWAAAYMTVWYVLGVNSQQALRCSSEYSITRNWEELCLHENILICASIINC